MALRKPSTTEHRGTSRNTAYGHGNIIHGSATFTDNTNNLRRTALVAAGMFATTDCTKRTSTAVSRKDLFVLVSIFSERSESMFSTITGSSNAMTCSAVSNIASP
jgi:hypothetical protein